MGVANDPATVFLFILLSCIGINSQLTMSQDQGTYNITYAIL